MDEDGGAPVAPGQEEGAAEVGREDESLRICPGKHRDAQIARAGARKLFKGKVRKLFLEYFAATANAKWSAERSGVAYQTVWKHRMKDPAFAADYDLALDQALARVRAKMVETRITGEPTRMDGDWEVPELEEIDPRIGLQILREHGWGLSGPNPAGRPKKAGRAPRAASNAQVRAELEKRLRAYARRMRAAGREPPPWLPPVEPRKCAKGFPASAGQAPSVIASEAKQSSPSSDPDPDRRGADAPRDDEP